MDDLLESKDRVQLSPVSFSRDERLLMHLTITLQGAA